jgi:PAS domain S-box-containing protein
MGSNMGHALAEELVSAALGDNHHLKTVLDALPAAVYATDADGVLTYANRAAEEMAGKRAEIGRDKWCVSWRLYHPDGTPLPLDQCPMSQALKEGRPIRGAKIVVERPDRTRALVTPFPTPIFDKAGKLIGAVNLLVDVTEENQRAQREVEQRRRTEHAARQLAAIVQSSDDAIIGKGLDSIVTSWNAGAQRLFGYSADEIVGKPVTTLFPPGHLDEETDILARIKRGHPGPHKAWRIRRSLRDSAPAQGRNAYRRFADRLAHKR